MTHTSQDKSKSAVGATARSGRGASAPWTPGGPGQPILSQTILGPLPDAVRITYGNPMALRRARNAARRRLMPLSAQEISTHSRASGVNEEKDANLPVVKRL